MIVKCIYTLILFGLCIIYAHSTFAFNVVLTPKEVHPGDIIFVKITLDTASHPVAEFRDLEVPFYPMGKGDLIALLPVDVSTPPGDYQVTINDREGSEVLSVSVSAYEFPTKKLTVSEEKVTLSSEDEKRVEEEYQLQQKLWERSSEKSWDGVFIMPTETPISEVFGVKRIFNEKRTSIHRGIDLKGRSGAPVRAVNTGRVVLRRDLFYGGNTLVLDHGMGLMSVYMHLSAFNVPDNTIVKKGDIIGFVGMSGRATGPHLHMSIKLQGISVNPLALIGFDL